jgi:hypothetical protein
MAEAYITIREPIEIGDVISTEFGNAKIVRNLASVYYEIRVFHDRHPGTVEKVLKVVCRTENRDCAACRKPFRATCVGIETADE